MFKYGAATAYEPDFARKFVEKQDIAKLYGDYEKLSHTNEIAYKRIWLHLRGRRNEG